MDDLPALVEQMREAGLRTQLWIEGEARPSSRRASIWPPTGWSRRRLTNSLRHAGAGAGGGDRTAWSA